MNPEEAAPWLRSFKNNCQNLKTGEGNFQNQLSRIMSPNSLSSFATNANDIFARTKEKFKGFFFLDHF